METREQALSATAFRDVTYPQLNLHDFTLDDNLSTSEPLLSECTQSCADLGVLEVLPLEIIHRLLVRLDLRSLTDFRRANRRATEIVSTIPQYKAITTYARNALRGSLIIGTGQFFSCETLYAKLCTAEGDQCGDFGGYLYLLTCARVCFLCLSEDNRFLPLRYSDATRKFGVPRHILNTLPHMKSIPGSYCTYSPNGKKVRDRVTLVDSESAYHAGIMLYGSLKVMEEYVANQADYKLRKYNERLSLTTTENPGSTARYERQTRIKDGFDRRAGNPIRFVSIVRTPWLNRSSQQPEWGFYCVGCRKGSRNRVLHWRRRFNKASFSTHLELCGDIRDGKHCKQCISESAPE